MRACSSAHICLTGLSVDTHTPYLNRKRRGVDMIVMVVVVIVVMAPRHGRQMEEPASYGACHLCSFNRFVADKKLSSFDCNVKCCKIEWQASVTIPVRWRDGGVWDTKSGQGTKGNRSRTIAPPLLHRSINDEEGMVCHHGRFDRP